MFSMEYIVHKELKIKQRRVNQMKLTTDLLRVSAKELNEVLELAPPIIVTTRAKLEEMQSGIMEAAQLLQDGDTITQATFDLLQEIEADIPAKIKITGKAKAKSEAKPESKEKTEKGSKSEKPAKKNPGGIPPSKLKDAERTKYGSVAGTAHGLLDELFIKGMSKESIIKKLEQTFPDKYDGSEDSK